MPACAASFSVVDARTPGHHSCQWPMLRKTSHTRADGWGKRQCVVKWNGADSLGRGTTCVWSADTGAASAVGDPCVEPVEGGRERCDAVRVEELLAQLLVETARRLVSDDDVVDRGAGVEDRR